MKNIIMAAAVLGSLIMAHPAFDVMAVQEQTPEDILSENVSFRIEVVAEGFEQPWAMAFLPDGRALVTDRIAGEISLIDVVTGEKTLLKGVPKSHFENLSGGLLDIIVHPDFAENNLIYFSYASRLHDRTSAVVDRARLDGNRLVDRERIFEAWPRFKYVAHLGLRLVLKDGYLFIAVGDRYVRDLAQVLNTHNGKIIRLFEDGAVPTDNPFISTDGALPEIWSYGHRNIQGMALHPETGELWTHEHGPRGGDEVNIIEPGLNYGWPIITYGEEYDDGPVGEGLTEKEGMIQPLYYYVPSIAPSGMEFYTGEAFPEWQGNLFIGALAMTHLNRLVINGNKVVHEERLLLEQAWRVRFVRQGLDGFLYLGNDLGMIVRLRPLD